MTRYSSLNRRTPLRRRGGPTRRTRIRGQSARRRQEQTVRAALPHEHLGARCRLALDGCTGDAEHFHELVGAGVGGSRVDRRNLVPACDACNSLIETLPDRHQRRLKVRSTAAKPGVGGLVPAVPHRLAIANDQEGWL